MSDQEKQQGIEYPPLDIGGLPVKAKELGEAQGALIEQASDFVNRARAGLKNADIGAFPWGRGWQDGLTKREYFAAMAMQGFCAGGIASGITGIAVNAVHLADATLAELEKSK